VRWLVCCDVAEPCKLGANAVLARLALAKAHEIPIPFDGQDGECGTSPDPDIRKAAREFVKEEAQHVDTSKLWIAKEESGARDKGRVRAGTPRSASATPDRCAARGSGLAESRRARENVPLWSGYRLARGVR
jgi:hypothetical protein